MKKSVLILIMLIGCLMLGSCAVSADQMLQEFNEQIYEDLGNGVYVTNNGEPNVSTTLIPNDVYRVMEQSVMRIEVDEGFMDYRWTLIDNNSKREIVIGDSFYININSAVLKLTQGNDYSIVLLVRSRNNLLFKDTATLNVVNNIYN